jgi:hypothetical protein
MCLRLFRILLAQEQSCKSAKVGTQLLAFKFTREVAPRQAERAWPT